MNVRFEPRFDDDCPVCGPTRTSCWGGGNKLCRKRDPRPSRLAAVLNTYGGLGVVVTYRNHLRFHVRHDDLLIVVPKTVVHEPIAWGDIPGLIAHIRWYVDRWIDENNPNEPHAQQAVRMYKLRCLEQNQRSLDLSSIVET